MNIRIVKHIMAGEKVSLVAESRNDNEIDGFILALRRMRPKVNVNCNTIILKNNVCRLTVDISVSTGEDWIESALIETFRKTKLEIHQV